MITLTAESKQWKNEKQYIARITGRAPKVTYAREFVGRRNGSFSSAHIDEPGIYELGNLDKKGNKSQVYRIVVEAPGGELIALKAGASNLDNTNSADAVVMEAAKRLDAGEKLAEMIEIAKREGTDEWGYRLRSKSAAKEASVGATVDAAIEQCWQILQAFPERDAKKVLAALKLRVSPKPVAAAEVTPKPVAEPTAVPDQV